MKIVFFGTPDYVLYVLNKLHKSFMQKGKSPIVAVVTQKPAPAGREKFITYSAVDKWAHTHGITTYYDPEDLIKDKVETDIAIVAAYGAKIPESVIKYFSKGMLVIHPSLLPMFRWGSPIQATIVTATNPTGSTILKMDEKFDHGPIVVQFKEELLPNDTTKTLRERLFEKSADVLCELLTPYLQGKIKLKEQDHDKATFARMLTKKDAFVPGKHIQKVVEGVKNTNRWKIDFIKNYTQEITALTIERFIRAMQPWPGAWTKVKINNEVRNLKLLKAHIEKDVLVLDEVQLESKSIVSWIQFNQGYPNFTFA